MCIYIYIYIYVYIYIGLTLNPLLVLLLIRHRTNANRSSSRTIYICLLGAKGSPVSPLFLFISTCTFAHPPQKKREPKQGQRYIYVFTRVALGGG